MRFHSSLYFPALCGLTLLLGSITEPTHAFGPEKIVNGNWTQGEPSTVALTINNRPFCSGTLVGCSTVVTAAHCVDGLPPQLVSVYTQHDADAAAVDRISVHPGWGVTPGNDIAVLHLSSPVSGIAPTPINDVAALPGDSLVTKTGFGVADDLSGAGIKRTVSFRTDAGFCPPGLVCYSILDPRTDGSACFGDSGGPMFADIDGTRRLVGVTSGGSSCTPPGFAVDTDVHFFREWLIATAAGDLGAASCGAESQAGDGDSTVTALPGYTGATGIADLTFTVDSGATSLDLTLNATSSNGTVRVRRGAAPTDTEADCEIGPFQGCRIDNPGAGQWFASFAGAPGVELQLTPTARFTVDSGDGQGGLPAAENPTDFCINTLRARCVDGLPGDHRFQITAQYTDPADNSVGNVYMHHISGLLGTLGYFFDAENPELLVKVLDGCAINGHHWLFSSTNTTLEHSVFVHDRHTGLTTTLDSAGGGIATPTADITAFPCVTP